MTLARGPVLTAVGAAAVVVAAVVVVLGVRGHAAPESQPSPSPATAAARPQTTQVSIAGKPSAVAARGDAAKAPVLPADTAVSAGSTPQIKDVPWADVPSAVVSWIHAHEATPTVGTVVAGGHTWAVLTSGRQPTAVRLLPLILTRSTTEASMEVALAPGASHFLGAHAALAVELQSGLPALTFHLHFVGGSRPTPLGALAAGTCAAGKDALSAVRACGPSIGLTGATFTDAQGGVRAVLGGQTLLVKTGQQGVVVVPTSVEWTGAAA